MKITYNALILLSSAAMLHGVVLFDDAVNGSASSNGSSPTPLVLSTLSGTASNLNPASNQILGTVSAGAGNTRNFYTFNIPTGFHLSAINLDAISVVDATGNTSNDPGFLALVAGATAATPGGGFANLGGQLYDPSLIGTNVLPGLSGGGISGGSGFNFIGPGDYTFVIQQTGTEVSSFTVDFQVAPEPSSALLASLSGLFLLGRRRR